VRKVVLISSANIYGNTDADPITEDVPPMPVGHYGCSKLAMSICARFLRSVADRVVRPFNYTGVGNRAASWCRRSSGILRNARRVSNLAILTSYEIFRTCGRSGRLLSAADSKRSGRCVQPLFRVGRSLAFVLDELTRQTGHAPEITTNPSFVRGAEVHRLIGGREACEGNRPGASNCVRTTRSRGCWPALPPSDCGGRRRRR